MAGKPKTGRQTGQRPGVFVKGDSRIQPGPGRPASEVVAACREAFARRIPLLEQFAADENLSSSERMKAIELLGKYGGLARVELTGGEEASPLTVRIVHEAK